MKVVGLITEYNPFHNGHKYHMEKAREITGADTVVVVMSGNFVQRGAPAVIDKYTRAQMALTMGASMVFELPVAFSCSSAEYFAYGAVSLLNQLGFVDSLCFGSEAGDIALLEPIAEILSKEPKLYQKQLLSYLKAGNSFPVSRANALKDYFSHGCGKPQKKLDLPAKMLEELLLSSNNILGIEYLKALKQLKSPMVPFTIRRQGSAYLDTSLSEKNDFSSATAIRGILENGNLLSGLEKSVPREVSSILEAAYQKSFPINENDFSDFLYYKLRTASLEELSLYGDVPKDLAFRIKRLLPSYSDFESFAMELKTKQFTLTRIKRSLLHIMLELPLYTGKNLSFIRLLGLRREASYLLKQVPESCVPIITKPAHGNRILDEHARKVFDHEILCNDLYNQIVYSRYGTRIDSDYTHPLVIL